MSSPKIYSKWKYCPNGLGIKISEKCSLTTHYLAFPKDALKYLLQCYL